MMWAGLAADRDKRRIATATSFKNDIAPMFAPYRANMMWRFDITDYDTVRKNAQMIYGRLSGTTGTQMPAPPLEPLTQAADRTLVQASRMDDG